MGFRLKRQEDGNMFSRPLFLPRSAAMMSAVSAMTMSSLAGRVIRMMGPAAYDMPGGTECKGGKRQCGEPDCQPPSFHFAAPFHGSGLIFHHK